MQSIKNILGNTGIAFDNFDNFDDDNKNCKISIQELQLSNRLENFLAKIPKRYKEADKKFKKKFELCSYFIQGSYGIGKTTMAFAVVLQNYQRLKSFEFTTIGMFLINSRKNDFNFQKYLTTGLLILDDLTMQNFSEYSINTLFEIINHRYNEELPTIITSSKQLKELNLPGSITARIKEEYEIITCFNPDKNKRKEPK